MPSAATVASTLYVGPGGGTGACQAPPFSSIQTAINGAAVGDTVHICAGTYRVPGLATSKELTFEGDGAATTIITNDGAVRGLLSVSAPSVTISGLTFTGGHAHDPGRSSGGAIAANAVTVIDSVLTGNSSYGSGGAISGTSITVINSSFSNNSAGGNGGFDGGAIHGSDIVIRDSTFSGNRTTEFGGAIRSQGNVSVTGSTFADNSGANGGAIYGGSATVVNSTFSANGANSSGGAIGSWGTVTATNTTFSGGSGLGGAIKAPNAVIANTIIAQPVPNACSGSFTDSGGNLATDASCGLSKASSRVVSAADLALGALADNGGATKTMALNAGSVAVDAGLDAVCVTAPVNGLDQRGRDSPARG